jgi:S-adenosylmethionine-diacylglycerol 3-amino-3-carboxypropyl transferase
LQFFETLNFSSTNEDGASEVSALAGCERILCVTGSGSRPLDMLLSEARQIVAIDANPAQNALLALKLAAIGRWDHAQYLRFLGIAPSPSRLACYSRLRDDLPDFARDYWDARPRLVARGIWSAGQWERLLRWNGRFVAMFRGQAIQALMGAASIEDQAEVWQSRFVGGPLRSRIEAAARDWVWRLVMREPAGDFLSDKRQVTQRLAEDFARASRSFLFRDSDIATLALRGKLEADGPLPLHLLADNYDLVRKRLDRIQLLTCSLAQLDTSSAGQFDGFSLSDFGSYCGPPDYAACWNGILAVAMSDARYCERLFAHVMPPPFAAIIIDQPLSERLSALDRSIVYRIRAGYIRQTGR